MAALWRALTNYVWSSSSQSSSSTSSDRYLTSMSSSCRGEEESPSLIELVDSEMFSFPQFAPQAPKPYGTDEFVRAHMLSEGGHQRAALRAWDDIEQIKKESLKRARARARDNARHPQLPPSRAISSLRALIAKKAIITLSPPALSYPVLTPAAQGRSPRSPTSPGPCQGSSSYFAASSSYSSSQNKPTSTSKSRQRHNLAAAFGPMAPGLIRSFEDSPPNSARTITPRVRVSSPLSPPPPTPATAAAVAVPHSAGQERDESSPFHNPWSSRQPNTNNNRSSSSSPRLSAKNRFAIDFPNGANIAASPSSLLSTSTNNNNNTTNGENEGLVSAFTAITQSMRNQLGLPWADIPEVADLVHYHHNHHSHSETSKSFTPQTLATALSAWYRYRYRYQYHNDDDDDDAQDGTLPRDNNNNNNLIALGIVAHAHAHAREGRHRRDDDSYRGVLVYVDDADSDSDANGGTSSTTIWIYHEAEAEAEVKARGGTKWEGKDAGGGGGEFLFTSRSSVFHALRAAEEELGVMARIRCLSS